jgi:hypothetical protein
MLQHKGPAHKTFLAKPPSKAHSHFLLSPVIKRAPATVFACCPMDKAAPMLETSIHPQDLPLFSDDLDRLEKVLDAVCEDRGISPRSPEAERLGALIIQLYRQGVKEDAKLLALARAYL